MNEDFENNELPKETVRVDANDMTDPILKEETDCKDISDEELASAAKKEKIEQEVISTVLDGILTFFQVW